MIAVALPGISWPPYARANSRATGYAGRRAVCVCASHTPTPYASPENWAISEGEVEVAHRYKTSREAPQIDGDSTLFAMLSEGAR